MPKKLEERIEILRENIIIVINEDEIPGQARNGAPLCLSSIF